MREAHRWWHNRPPYGPQALAATASLEFVTEQAAQAALGDGVHAPPNGPGDQLILGRVSWRLPPTPQPGGAFWIVVLDKRTDLKPGTFAVGSPLHQQVSIASGGTLQRVADRSRGCVAPGPSTSMAAGGRPAAR